jgi:hypothetical protein
MEKLFDKKVNLKLWSCPRAGQGDKAVYAAEFISRNGKDSVFCKKAGQ